MSDTNTMTWEVQAAIDIVAANVVVLRYTGDKPILVFDDKKMASIIRQAADAQLATLRAENERLRDILSRMRRSDFADVDDPFWNEIQTALVGAVVAARQSLASHEADSTKEPE